MHVCFVLHMNLKNTRSNCFCFGSKNSNHFAVPVLTFVIYDIFVSLWICVMFGNCCLICLFDICVLSMFILFNVVFVHLCCLFFHSNGSTKSIDLFE